MTCRCEAPEVLRPYPGVCQKCGMAPRPNTHPAQAEGEHNALADARWNRDLYAFLMDRRAR